MARAVGDPRLGLAVREVHGDERRSQVVDADGPARLALLEELAPGDASQPEVRAQGFRQVASLLEVAEDSGGLLDVGLPVLPPLLPLPVASARMTLPATGTSARDFSTGMRLKISWGR